MSGHPSRILGIPQESGRGGRLSPSQAVAYSRTKEGISDSGALARGSLETQRDVLLPNPGVMFVQLDQQMDFGNL